MRIYNSFSENSLWKDEFLNVKPYPLTLDLDELISPASHSRRVIQYERNPTSSDPPRPLNAFFLYRKDFSAKLRKEGIKMKNGDVSHLVSEEWNKQPKEVLLHLPLDEMVVNEQENVNNDILLSLFPELSNLFVDNSFPNFPLFPELSNINADNIPIENINVDNSFQNFPLSPELPNNIDFDISMLPLQNFPLSPELQNNIDFDISMLPLQNLPLSPLSPDFLNNLNVNDNSSMLPGYLMNVDMNFDDFQLYPDYDFFYLYENEIIDNQLLQDFTNFDVQQ
ncbi:10715_t:CDS:2 [Scutellospora calospora]|uniref:10715_t:CDS:1 n=1 Tax=Scutellospora calospora TaxID=85575 RepID=A0ACA9LP91_9GLOM|nr:10715_t:CDS:2 [Scutellospora calospora]